MKKSYLSRTQLADFFAEFYLLRRAKLSESEALSIIAEDQESKIMQKFLARLTPDLIHGLTEFALPDYIIVLLTRTKTNIDVFSDIAEHLKQHNYKKQIINALWYPILVLLIALLLASLIFIFVLPVFNELFTSIGTVLPMITQCFIDISYYAPVVLGLLFILSLLLVVCLKSRYGFQFLLNIPMLNSIISGIELMAILNTLYLLIKHQFSFTEALRLSVTASKYPIVNNLLNTCSDDVIWSELAKTRIFSTKTLRLLKVFADSQELAILENLLLYHQRITQEKINVTLCLLTVMLSILCWLFVGMMVIALYLPIFQLGSVIT